jgi:4-hydroxyphenylacetate 3-monooxygenase
MSEATGQLAGMQAFADKCMSEYDLDGWTGNGLVNPDDVNVLKRFANL